MKIFKKVLAMFLCFAMIFGFASMVDVSDLFKAEAATKYTSGYYTYTVSYDKVKITDVDTSISGDIIIPLTLDGYPVTTIESYSFDDCVGVTSVTIHEGITNISEDIFRKCPNLTSIIVASENPKYSSDQYGVLFNKNKTKLIQYPLGNARTSYTIPDSVKDIAYRAFCNCTNLTDIKIPDGVATIGGEAFYNTGFYNNSKNWENGVLYNGKHLIDTKETIGEVYVIKNGTLIVADYAFSYSQNLMSVTFPDSVTAIGRSSFIGCDNLEKMEMGNGVKNIGEFAFAYCDKLVNARIGNGVTLIDDKAFSECKALECVTISDSVETIGLWAFDDCTSLKKVVIGKGVKKIAASAFVDCANITDVYYTGSEVEWNAISIGQYNENLTGATIHYNHVHDYSTLVVKKPTCTEKGEGIFTCECGDKYTDKLPELKHDIVIDEAVESTCTETGLTAGQHCSRCDGATVAQEVVPTIPHNFAGTYNSEKHWQECYCGEAVAERDHDFTSGNTCGCGYKRVSDAVISINNNTGSKTINYGETLKLTAVVTNKPADAVVVWYVNGIKSAEGETFFIGFEGGTKTVEVKLLDSNGIVYEGANDDEISDSQTVTVKNGFFQKIISFFKNLFGMNRTVIQAIFKGIY